MELYERVGLRQAGPGEGSNNCGGRAQHGSIPSHANAFTPRAQSWDNSKSPFVHEAAIPFAVDPRIAIFLCKAKALAELQESLSLRSSPGPCTSSPSPTLHLKSTTSSAFHVDLPRLAAARCSSDRLPGAGGARPASLEPSEESHSSSESSLATLNSELESLEDIMLGKMGAVRADGSTTAFLPQGSGVLPCPGTMPRCVCLQEPAPSNRLHFPPPFSPRRRLS